MIGSNDMPSWEGYVMRMSFVFQVRLTTSYVSFLNIGITTSLENKTALNLGAGFSVVSKYRI
jgi:hypothetical protein